ncbi:MAG: carboxypeptidase-like regulatory domain-containing protein, partial [Muribaculaceae bacterium]|nr:carboxypeptidase-like regulatory domain-containing protein [Muribaculaceae bacterium]
MKRVPVPTREAALMAALLFIIQLSAFMSNASTNLAPDKKSSTFETPDFAFPENVEKDAMPYFKEAVSVKNGLDALKAAIQVVVARNLVSQSSFNDNAEMLDSAANALDAPYSQLFYLLEATLYRQLYQDNAWNYNQRLLPADSLSGDPLSWGRNQFCKKVLELTEKAVSADAFSKAMSIKYIAPLLVNSEQAEKCGLSVYDFLVYSSVKNLKSFGNDIYDKVIPFRNIKSTDSSLPSQCSRKADSLLDGLYEYHNKKGNIAAEVVAAVEWAKNMEPGKQIAILNDLKDRLIHNEWDARPLHAYYQSVRYNSDVFTLAVQKQLYSQMNDWLKEFPDAYGSPVVKYDLDELSKKGVRIEVANVALPHTALKGKATFSNVNSAYVLIYKVPESLVTVNSVNMSKFPSGCSKVASVPIAVKGEIPFSEKCEFEIPGLAPGRYVMIPSQTSNLTAGWRDRLELWSVGAVNVTDIALISLTNSSEENSGMVYVVDSRNQKPIAGAQVIVYGNDGKKMVKSGKTNSEGGFVMPKGYYRVRVKNGQSSAEEWVGYSY